jgi:hypothetical protein
MFPRLTPAKDADRIRQRILVALLLLGFRDIGEVIVNGASAAALLCLLGDTSCDETNAEDDQADPHAAILRE